MGTTHSMNNLLSKPNILITGQPGIGKTTLIRRVVEQLTDRQPAGFYTTEIREKGRRVGFELVDLDGRRSILAHINLRSKYRVGRYCVDVDAFEVFLEHLSIWDREPDIIVIDEIGKMECLSPKFNRLLNEYLDVPVPVLATIALKGSGMIQKVKKRNDIHLIHIHPDNRDTLVSEISDKLYFY